MTFETYCHSIKSNRCLSKTNEHSKVPKILPSFRSINRWCRSLPARLRSHSLGTQRLVRQYLWIQLQDSRESNPEIHFDWIPWALFTSSWLKRRSAMSHDTALKLLGLSGGQNKTRAGVGGTSQAPPKSGVGWGTWLHQDQPDQLFSRCRALWRISRSRK